MIVCRTIAFSAVTIALTALPNSATAAESLGVQLRTAVELDAVSSEQASARFFRLRATSGDPRVPYVQALLLIDRKKYNEALPPIREAVELAPGNLSAWKTQIWLEVVTANVDDALASMESLTKIMPAQAATTEPVERQCVAYCGFMGSLFGYLQAPLADSAATNSVTFAESRVLQKLSGDRRNAFIDGREAVFTNYANRYDEIHQLLGFASQRVQQYTQARLADLQQERNQTASELAEVEDRRERSRQLASDERNVIAATRDESVQASGAAGRTRYSDVTEFAPFYRQAPNAKPTDPWTLDHVYDRNTSLRSGYAAGSYAAQDRGLDDRHYADVNRRETDENDRLDELKSDLGTRLRRIAKDEKRLMLRPNAGYTPRIKSKKLKAKALSTYVSLPVDPGHEVREILASVR